MSAPAESASRLLRQQSILPTAPGPKIANIAHRHKRRLATAAEFNHDDIQDSEDTRLVKVTQRLAAARALIQGAY
jgi:hypothetical protein